MSCSADCSLIALVSQDDSGDLDIYQARTGNYLGHLPGLHGTSPQYVVDLQFSLDSKWLLCRYLTRWESDKSRTYIFDLTNFSAHHHFNNAESEEYEIIPGPDGFWISQWDSFNKKLTLTYLDARTGRQTILDSAISSGLAGSPRIFSDNSGHLYLIQGRTPLPDDWLQRTRKTILGWLKKLDIEWKTANEIVIRQISPDGKRIIDEQAFHANVAEISPEGQYLVLMTQMNEECRYTVYHYPICLNWKHSLLWSLIPLAILVLLLFWRSRLSRPLPPPH